MTVSARGSVPPAWFAGCMDALGPFESAPHVATACSGGPDSMALTLLANRWARSRGGRCTALVVDHGMRPESAREAAMVREWLAAAGIDAVTLTREGPPPESNRQAQARHARYALMRRWCREAGVMHLLLGHHSQDQAETLLLRLARGSGVDGLAAMAPVLETADVRLLRPLLDVPAKHLAAFMEAEGQPFLSDPSNKDSAYARVRIRGLLPGLEREGLTVSRLSATARRMARARAALDGAATALLARAAAIYPEGFATLSPGPLYEAPEEVALRALSRLLSCIGGAEYGPRLEHLERLYAWVCNENSTGRGRTRAGGQVSRRGGGFLVCREAKATEEPVAAVDSAVWDRRFRVVAGGRPSKRMRVGRLGQEGWRQLVDERPDLRKSVLPAPVRYTLPAIWVLDEIAAVPHLNYRSGTEYSDTSQETELTFAPGRPLGAAAFVSVTGYP